MRKNFLLLPGCFACGLLEGFFLSLIQKNPENSPKAKTSLTKAKQFFFLSNDEKCCALTLK